MNKNKYLLRTMMFVPVHIETLMYKAYESEADALVFDL